MPQEIYNEGRVVGYSAWEIFARNLDGRLDPQDIPNEKQWLTAMIGSGASMILKIPIGTQAGIRDFALPSTSSLTATGVIIANPFLGDCDFDVSNWATNVKSYSPLISNTSTLHPSTGTQEVPSGNYNIESYADLVSNFSKIVDGIVYTKNAKWEDSASEEPEKDIDPNFKNSSTVIRLYINADITSDIYVLFTGFNNKAILQGLSGWNEGGVGGSTDTEHNDWANGGMLGPEIIPWATKIVFSVPTSTYNLVNSLTRTIPHGISATDITIDGTVHFNNLTGTVKTNSLIDLDSINLTDYYSIHTFSELPTIQEDVTNVALGVSNSYNELVAWYPGMTATKITTAKQSEDTSKIFPPALYATQITSNGTATLVPLDTAAPGTVKGFNNATQAYNYTQQMPDNYSIFYNSTTKLFTFVTPNEPDSTKWSGTSKIEYLDAPKAKLTTGNQSVKFIALNNSNGTDYNTAGSAGTTTSSAGNRGKITWDNLLASLNTGKTYDTFGDRLRYFATELDSNKIGTTANNRISEVNTEKVTLRASGGSASITNVRGDSNTINYATFTNNSTVQLGTNFIKFGNGLKLYISSSNPGTTNVPTGSIGIGW